MASAEPNANLHPAPTDNHASTQPLRELQGCKRKSIQQSIELAEWQCFLFQSLENKAAAREQKLTRTTNYNYKYSLTLLTQPATIVDHWAQCGKRL